MEETGEQRAARIRKDGTAAILAHLKQGGSFDGRHPRPYWYLNISYAEVEALWDLDPGLVKELIKKYEETKRSGGNRDPNAALPAVQSIIMPYQSPYEFSR